MGTAYRLWPQAIKVQECRWKIKLEEFEFDIKYTQVKTNYVEDELDACPTWPTYTMTIICDWLRKYTFHSGKSYFHFEIIVKSNK